MSAHLANSTPDSSSRLSPSVATVTKSRQGATDCSCAGVRIRRWCGVTQEQRARTTALVCCRLRRRKTIDRKHVTAFTRLLGLGRQEQLAAAWSDHRQAIPGTLDDATREAIRLLEAHPELVVVEEYSAVVMPCERCREQGPFRPGPADRIVQMLGYW